ncbi:30S ribosomal protein S27e [Bienertia sinuspersici]
MATSTSSLLPPTSFHKKLKLNHHSILFPPHPIHLQPRRRFPQQVVSFQRDDFESLKQRVLSGEALKEAWRSANDGFEQLVYEAKKAAERFDRRYSVSRRVSSAAEAASIRARELDREYELTQKWRAFSLDFSRNLPRYRKQFKDFLDTPIGKSSTTIFFLWFALSGWLFRSLIFATWVLPIAGPLLISAVANNMTVKGACPSCKREFIGVKNSVVRCQGCGNIVWQPKGDFSSRGNKGTRQSRSNPDIIDVDFEEKR